jgi:hypothetical protein
MLYAKDRDALVLMGNKIENPIISNPHLADAGKFGGIPCNRAC